MKMSSLKNKANRSTNPSDMANYKKQCNLVVSLNRQAKSEYSNEVSNSKSSRPFSGTLTQYFSNICLQRF